MVDRPWSSCGDRQIEFNRYWTVPGTISKDKLLVYWFTLFIEFFFMDRQCKFRNDNNYVEGNCTLPAHSSFFYFHKKKKWKIVVGHFIGRWNNARPMTSNPPIPFHDLFCEIKVDLLSFLVSNSHFFFVLHFLNLKEPYIPISLRQNSLSSLLSYSIFIKKKKKASKIFSIQWNFVLRLRSIQNSPCRQSRYKYKFFWISKGRVDSAVFFYYFFALEKPESREIEPLSFTAGEYTPTTTPLAFTILIPRWHNINKENK